MNERKLVPGSDKRQQTDEKRLLEMDELLKQ